MEFRVQAYQYRDLEISHQFRFLPGPMTETRAKALELTWEGTVEADDEQAACEAVFALLNRDNRPTAKTTYSFSTGDVVRVMGGQAYMCMGIGFQDVSLNFDAVDDSLQR